MKMKLSNALSCSSEVVQKRQIRYQIEWKVKRCVQDNDLPTLYFNLLHIFHLECILLDHVHLRIFWTLNIYLRLFPKSVELSLLTFFLVFLFNLFFIQLKRILCNTHIFTLFKVFFFSFWRMYFISSSSCVKVIWSSSEVESGEYPVGY